VSQKSIMVSENLPGIPYIIVFEMLKEYLEGDIALFPAAFYKVFYLLVKTTGMIPRMIMTPI